MNKPYFAKYLPVEGDIKEHSIVFAGGKLGTVVYISEQLKWYEVEFDDESRVTPLPASEVKPAKLSLCSRDIQVGDTVINPDTLQKEEMTQEIWDYWHITEAMWNSQPYFKDIGEISHDATWVKQRDEFDEEQISIPDHPTCPLCGAISNDGFCPYDVDCQILKARKVIKIMGSCGYFH